MRREIGEEYGVEPTSFAEIGLIETVDNQGVLHNRHVFVVTSWNGKTTDTGDGNLHVRAPIVEARELCVHPISQRALDILEDYRYRKVKEDK